MIQYLAIAICVWWLLLFLHRRKWLPFCPFCAAKRDFIAWAMKRYRREIRKRSPLGFRMQIWARGFLLEKFNAILKELLETHLTAERLLGVPIPLSYGDHEFPSARGYIDQKAGQE